MTKPFIRPYEPRDFENGVKVFLATIDKDLDYDPARNICSWIWFRSYVALAPELAFVLDDGTSRAVGYCLGTADTIAFRPYWVKNFSPTVDKTAVPPPGEDTGDEKLETEDLQLFRECAYTGNSSPIMYYPWLERKYPAHLHINILPEFQRKGYGKQMMEVFLEKIKNEGAKGVHLGMKTENTGAFEFYKQLGFEVCPSVLDGGKSGKMGIGPDGDVMTLVQEFPSDDDKEKPEAEEVD